jgi:hypothetical protein
MAVNPISHIYSQDQRWLLYTMKSKTYHNVGAVPNYNRKSVETGKIDTTNTHMLPVPYLLPILNLHPLPG